MEWQEIVCAENPFDFFARKNGAVVPVQTSRTSEPARSATA
jgi:hypothetical protein